MAAAFKALNAKIRSNKYLDYFCSTHFWGPASNFGIPLAAIADMSKDPEIISGPLTASLSLYSATFMRYSLAVSPANYLLFGCHAINFTSQIVQGYRYINYNNLGGKELAIQTREAAKHAEGKVEAAVKSVGK
ncbi:eukaryotic protein [Karstenula rhodostoma CBS 690.94]|uniref:Mitochondrial pyruvate carrier n=1 Tax=Karstenula rhodostoma CBS 690.94 TaxID=1392251 RepID=A0A9P4P9Y0_9PLEO|nr:eukaryotic protein [Karstenula rhodostoma CBS 690.94]